ncbi:hypothetical protein HB777_06070 [Mesorhizobium loti]|nr:hypothetical protein HB777_06070 [Mesorhizobium loti]
MITGYEAFKQSNLFGFADITHKIGDNDVDSVFYSLLLIQNRGTIAIHPSDLNDGGDIYLRLSDRISKDTKPFLLTKVVEIDDPSANISIENNQVLMNDHQALKLKFDYLPPKSGILIECLSNINPKEFFIKTKTKDHGSITKAYPDIRKFLLIALASFISFLYIFLKH